MTTPDARLREFLPNARELALLLAARGLACVAAWVQGFRALSDDDYARISIAQRFAYAPHFDPTGTSWLPAPFWAYGAVFRVFGTGLGVARATAIVAGLCATVLVYVAARLIGVDRFGALLGAALSCLIVNYSGLLGIAALPEVPCAALLLFSAATLSRPELNLRGLGGTALIAASLSRYEAWPIAVVFAAFCGWDALRRTNVAFAVCAALAVTGPVLWLLVGHFEHGSALFFVARVTAYRHAVGGPEASTLKKLFEYPWLALRDEFVVWLIWLIFAFTRPKEAYPGHFGRCELALLAMLGFLMLGSVRDGVPTHHAGRVLLPIWFFVCVACGHAFGARATSRARQVTAAVVVAFLGSTAFSSGFIAQDAEGFAQRSNELTAGAAARKFTSSALAIDTADYGYFAVQAGFGSPIGTTVLDDHDPRRPIPSPFSSAQTLDRELQEQRAGFVIVTKAHAALLDPRCSKLWDNAGFALFQCAPGRG